MTSVFQLLFFRLCHHNHNGHFDFRHHFQTATFCNRALGLKSGRVKNKQITVSSVQNKHTVGPLGRLGQKKRGAYVGAWVARHNNHNQWFKIDFLGPVEVSKICTQGRDDTKQWVTRLTVSYSQDDLHWAMYRSLSSDKVIDCTFIGMCFLCYRNFSRKRLLLR